MKFLTITLISLLSISGFAEIKKSTSDKVGSGKDEAKKILNILEKEFRDIKSISADFDQIKKMKLFKRDIKLKGRLVIKFPQYFRWEVDEPIKTTVTAEDGIIEIWDEATGKTQKVSTKTNPVVKDIWGQIDSWFMGKYVTLAKDYDIYLYKSEKKVSGIPVIYFKPKSKPLSLVIEKVSLSFNEGNKKTSGRKYLKKVVLYEKTGDSTIIEFKNVKITLLKK